MPSGAALGGAAALRMPAQLPPPTFANPGASSFPAGASFGPSLEAMMAVSWGNGGGGGGGAGAGSLFGDALTEATLLQQQMLAGSLPYGAATGGSAAGFAAPRGSGDM